VRPTQLFLRSFLIQASWNPRDLLGTGVAWVLGPALRDGEGDGERRAISRSSEPFNAHPFLAGIALGAMVRMAREGVPEATQRRFREAVRGPLGSLGDGLIWAGWLPSSLLLAGVALVAGLPPGLSVVLFLLLFNGFHLPLRAWGIRAGLEAGLAVAPVLQAARLQVWGERSRALGVLLIGALGGLTWVRAGAAFPEPGLWGGVAAALLLVGIWRGRALPSGAPGALALLFLLLLLGLQACFGGVTGSSGHGSLP
jgi:mannose PTS system EIID component